MSKTKDIFKLLENAPDDVLGEIEKKQPHISRKCRNAMYKASVRKAKAADTYLSASPRQVLDNSLSVINISDTLKLRRIGAAAACLVVTAAAVFAIKSAAVLPKRPIAAVPAETFDDAVTSGTANTASGYMPYTTQPDPDSIHLDVSVIAGTWYLESSLWNDKLTIDNSVSFTYENDGHTLTGSVRIEQGESENGASRMFFNFYTDDELLWNSFPVSSDTESGDLENESPKGAYFRRLPLVIDKFEETGELSAYFGSLAGVYKNAGGYGKITSLVISPDGSFTAYGTSEEGISGRASLFSRKKEDGTDELCCSLIFDGSNSPFITFPVNDIVNMGEPLYEFSFIKENERY